MDTVTKSLTLELTYTVDIIGTSSSVNSVTTSEQHNCILFLLHAHPHLTCSSTQTQNTVEKISHVRKFFLEIDDL